MLSVSFVMEVHVRIKLVVERLERQNFPRNYRRHFFSFFSLHSNPVPLFIPRKVYYSNTSSPGLQRVLLLPLFEYTLNIYLRLLIAV